MSAVDFEIVWDEDGMHLKRTIEINEETLKLLQNDKTMELIRQAIEDEVNRQFEKRLKRLLNGEYGEK